jgi:hypothetical protein
VGDRARATGRSLSVHNPRQLSAQIVIRPISPVVKMLWGERRGVWHLRRRFCASRARRDPAVALVAGDDGVTRIRDGSSRNRLRRARSCWRWHAGMSLPGEGRRGAASYGAAGGGTHRPLPPLNRRIRAGVRGLPRLQHGQAEHANVDRRASLMMVLGCRLSASRHYPAAHSQAARSRSCPPPLGSGPPSPTSPGRTAVAVVLVSAAASSTRRSATKN